MVEGKNGRWIVHQVGRPASEGVEFRTLAEAQRHLEWLPKGDAAPISGQLWRTSSKTPGHTEVGNTLAKQAAESGQYERVYLGTSVETITGHPITPRRAPDVVAVRPDGRIDIWEVESAGDNAFDLLNRGQDVLKQLPEASRGRVIVARPSGIVKDVNSSNSYGSRFGKTSADADAAFADPNAAANGFITVPWSK